METAAPKSMIRLEGVTKVFYTDEVETHALGGVHLGRRAQDDGVDVVAGQDLVQVDRSVVRTVLLRDLLGLLQPAADHGRDGNAVDGSESFEVLDPERAGPGECDSHV